jgi:hypothetical protein
MDVVNVDYAGAIIYQSTVKTNALHYKSVLNWFLGAFPRIETVARESLLSQIFRIFEANNGSCNENERKT